MATLRQRESERQRHRRQLKKRVFQLWDCLQGEEKAGATVAPPALSKGRAQENGKT
ncbi:MAG: hypothetical protein AAFY98_09120 [Verrucomicrobiota bacterium]